MRILSSLFFLLCLLFSFPSSIYAHIAGQPPFFLMNDKYADYYPVYSTSLTNFTLPQDIAPDTYLVNEPITFEIDTQILPFPPEVIEQMTFSWDFGDGTQGEGTTNTHSYTEPGSYLLTVNADYGDYSDPNTKPVIQAVLLHVLPEASYQLPSVAIKINDKLIEDPLLDTVTFPTGERLQFSAQITGGTAPITSYFWDRGDGTSTKEKEFTYQYSSNDPSYLFPFVRVVDQNGFIVDTYAQVENDTTSTAPNSSWFKDNAIFLLVGVNVVFLGGIGYFLLKKR